MATFRKPARFKFYAVAAQGHPRSWGFLVASLVAATFSTAAQVVLWILFTDDWPLLLFRDARLAAAIVMGPGVLPPPASFDLAVMTVASLVHVALSLAYTALLVAFVERNSGARGLITGAAFGLALYIVNMYGFTVIFPWFVQSRDWIAAMAHVAFGVGAAGSYRIVRGRRVA
jgi:hypothetical protein